MDNKAVVLLSGGMDSATVLAIARDDGYACYALSVDYGQRSQIELRAACACARFLGAQEHRTMHVDLASMGGSALTDASIPLPDGPSQNIPASYVPARNTVLLSLALAWAETLGASDIYLGVNAVDYSGYPDCRPEYVRAFQALVDVATHTTVDSRAIRINAPLLDLSKLEIIQRGMGLGVDYGMTISCYRASPEQSACGRCDSCYLRSVAFDALGVEDPLLQQVNKVDRSIG